MFRRTTELDHNQGFEVKRLSHRHAGRMPSGLNILPRFMTLRADSDHACLCHLSTELRTPLHC